MGRGKNSYRPHLCVLINLTDSLIAVATPKKKKWSKAGRAQGIFTARMGRAWAGVVIILPIANVILFTYIFFRIA